MLAAEKKRAKMLRQELANTLDSDISDDDNDDQ